MTRFRSPAVLLLSLCSAATAHVFWLQPSSYRPAANSLIKISLRVGDSFPGEGVPRNEERISRFTAVGPGGEQLVIGHEGSDPAGVARYQQAGTYVLGYASNPTPVRLEAAKFESYLREKGLEKIIERRAEAGQSGSAAREVYSRCAKAVIAVGDASGKGFDTTLGQRLEIIPEVDPLGLHASDSLTCRVLFDGTPRAGLLMQARNAARSELRTSARTDARGRVTLTIGGPGLWVIDGVEMIPAPADSDADWASYWASLSFEVPGNASTTEQAPADRVSP